MYYVCRVVDFPKVDADQPTEIVMEIVDCKVPTLNPTIFNKAFSNRELAEQYIRNIGASAVTYVVVYTPR